MATEDMTLLRLFTDEGFIQKVAACELRDIRNMCLQRVMSATAEDVAESGSSIVVSRRHARLFHVFSREWSFAGHLPADSISDLRLVIRNMLFQFFWWETPLMRRLTCCLAVCFEFWKVVQFFTQLAIMRDWYFI